MSLLNYWHDWVKEKCVLKNARDKAPGGLIVYKRTFGYSALVNGTTVITSEEVEGDNVLPIALLECDGQLAYLVNVTSVEKRYTEDFNNLHINLASKDGNPVAGKLDFYILGYDKSKFKG